MKLFVGLISSNAEVCKSYEKEKDRLVPRDVLLNHPAIRRLNPAFVFGAFDTSRTNNKWTVEEYLLHATRQVDGAILMFDRGLAPSKLLRSAYFGGSIEIPDTPFNFNNFFHQRIVRLLKNFALLLGFMSRADFEQAMILPIRNFAASELSELADICRENTMSGDFGNRIGPPVTALMNRKRPRRNSPYPTRHFFDDRGLYFAFGKERHARIATGPPHNYLCEISGNFRFGKRISVDRHFNVTYGTEGSSIQGTFPNCHDAQIVVVSQTHLNMFSNDHH